MDPTQKSAAESCITDERRDASAVEESTVVAIANRSAEVPLCVDLDGTLLRTDMLFESLLVLLKRRPGLLVLLPYWVWRGKAHLKTEIARRIDLSDGVFPINEDVLNYVRKQRQHRHTVLVTGSHESFAKIIASQTDAFDEVKGSDAAVNLTGHQKCRWLVDRFGEHAFDYVGNDSDDIAVWNAGRNSLVVSPPDGIARRSRLKFSHVFEARAVTWRDLLSLMRVHQWSKNALVLVPYVLDQRFDDVSATIAIVLAFLAMSFLASATYIVNDLLDLQSDRQHTTKQYRALPSGRVPIKLGLLVMACLAVATALLCLFLPLGFNLMLAAYLVLTLSYSLWLKERPIVDVLMIAGLHTLRVIGGTLAIAAVWSFWLLAFSTFIFFSLALAKRVAELINLEKIGRLGSIGRNYQVADIPVLLTSGVSTGYLSILVVALYINSDKVSTNYDQPMILWLVCPILMFWVGRVWIRTARGQMHEDPIVFAIRDRLSRIVFIMLALVLLAAMVV